ncbi:MAG: hypothetical protein QNJ11_00260 [Woeseiaceae bacterium]|nr:hypothetical protein [Woeseiaceae bacterium]
MNKGMIGKMLLLGALLSAAGCASTAPGVASGNAILSAADADRMITVTVTPAKTDALVAALNQEAE